MTHKKAVLFLILVSALSLLFLLKSGIAGEHIYKPLTLSTKIVSEDSLGINMPFFIFFILLFPASYSILCLCSLSSKDLNYTILVAQLIVIPVIFLFLGISFSTLLISIGFVISSFIAYRTSYMDKDYYKKISVYGITAKSTSKALLVMNIILIISVYLLIPSNPQELQKNFEKDLSGAMVDIMPAIISLNDEQKKQSYQFIEYMETSLLNSMESGMSSMTTSERKKCTDVLEENMKSIDSQTKAQIDKRFEDRANATGSYALIPESMTRQFSSYHPLLIVFTLFVTLELLRIIFFAPLSGTYAWLLSRLISKSPDEKSVKTPNVQKTGPNQNNNNAPHTSSPDTISNTPNPYYYTFENQLPAYRRTTQY